MAPERMEPGRTERNEDGAGRRDKASHMRQHFLGVGEVLKGIERYQDISRFRGLGRELAPLCHTRCRGSLPGPIQYARTDIHTDHAASAASCDLHGLLAIAASEV